MDVCIQNTVAELKLCSNTRNLRRGKELHGDALASGSVSCIYVANSLVSMYAKCGCMVEARQVFDRIKHPDVVSWSALILGYAANGMGAIALDLFTSMRSQHGCIPNSVTFLAVLKACTSLALQQDENQRAQCLEWGRRIHSQINCRLNVHIQNTLVDMYAKCRSMADARRVFDGIKRPDVVSWNALILGYAENGEGATALDLFARMKSLGRTPDSFTFVAALKACTSLALEQDANERAGCLETGQQLHSEIGPHSDIRVRNTLIDMYAKCRSMVHARHVFENAKHRDLVSWNALMLGYAESGEGVEALNMLTKMRCQGYAPDCVTYVAAFKACALLALEEDGCRAEWLERGRQMHTEMSCCHSDIYVQSTLINMYSNCGSMDEARQVFDGMNKRNAVSWNTLILGYAENGEALAALEMFTRMKLEGCVPDHVTFVAVLKACALLGALELGSKAHAEVESGMKRNAAVRTSLVDFYGKCGSMAQAQVVFDLDSGTRDVKAWTALLAGYSRLGDDESVFRLLEWMQDAGVQPNDVTLLCVLSCCSHAGLVAKAVQVFHAMPGAYGVTPTVEHYSCMLDILGRSNKLDDALALLRRMPQRPHSVIWITLLAACYKWKNLEIGSLAFESLVSCGGANASAFTLMAHLYGSKCMWEEQEMILRRMQN